MKANTKSYALKDKVGGWKHFAALGYAIAADSLGLFLMLASSYGKGISPMSTTGGLLKLLLGMAFAAHGRIIASYLVHEAAHNIVFKEEQANDIFGVICLCFAGIPYADIGQIRKMHVLHHRDRADPVEFDYRDFVKSGGAILKYLFLGLEWFFLPAVETFMQIRCAFYPFFYPKECTESRRRTAWWGTPAAICYYWYLWNKKILLPQLVVGGFILHFLSFSDSFHHTYEAIFMTDENYKPGPGSRTAQFEEDNTYSNVLSIRYPWLNVLHLNFGYHNAHHKKPTVPWYDLPEYHKKVYSGENPPCVIPVVDVLHAWFKHRLTRILEEDYGVVHPPGTPGRANDFVGALGVSFLTV